MTAKTRASAADGREIEDAVSYAIGHGIRIEILAILNEGVRSQGELARHLHLPQSKIQHHISELLRSGSIEEVEGRRTGNIVERRYRALTKGEYTADDYRRMTEETRRVTVGVTLQNAVAEHLAAFRAGEMVGDDPDLFLKWDWFNVDEEGRAEVTSELTRSWERLHEIEARSAARRMRTGEAARSVIVSSVAHPRVRPAPEERGLGTMIEGP